jgi:hypothetical protein
VALEYPGMTHVSIGRHRGFRASTGVLHRGRRAVAEIAYINNPETLIKAVMRGEGTAGHRLVCRNFATQTGRPGSYFGSGS